MGSLQKYSLTKYTLEKYNVEKYTLGKHTLEKYTLGKTLWENTLLKDRSLLVTAFGKYITFRGPRTLCNSRETPTWTWTSESVMDRISQHGYPVEQHGYPDRTWVGST